MRPSILPLYLLWPDLGSPLTQPMPAAATLLWVIAINQSKSYNFDLSQTKWSVCFMALNTINS